MTNKQCSAWCNAVLITVLCCISPAGAQPPDQSQTNSVSAERERRMERRSEHEHRQRAFPLDELPPGARRRALDQISQSTQAAPVPAEAAAGLGFRWFNIGPGPIDRLTGDSYVSSGDQNGRVTAIAVDPTNPDHWLIGAAQGGIWGTANAGVDWAPLTDNQPSLAMGAITFAPGNPLVVYAGTGEANFSGDSYAGMGLLKSLSGGNSWFVVAEAPFAETAISEIKVHPADSDQLVLATTRGVLGRVDSATNLAPTVPARGVFVSSNGGTNWVQTLVGEATDLEVDPGNFSRQYAALGEILGSPANGVYRSLSGGLNWTLIQGPWMTAPGPENIGRIEMAIAPSNPNRLYVSVAWKRTSGFTDLVAIWRTEDNAWAATPTWKEVSDASGPDGQFFAWYSHDLLVHPTNPDVVYFAGFWPWRYNGSSWTELENQHADQHALAWRRVGPGNYHVLVGNDGGLVSRADPSGAWVRHHHGLSIVQLYKGAVHPDDSSLILGASQDNGTEVWNGDQVWPSPLSGDGYSCAVSSSKPDTHWAASHQESGGKSIYRTTNGKDFVSVASGIDPSTISFFIVFQKHPANDNLFIAGAANLWRCNDFFSSSPGSPAWTVNSPVLTKADGTTAEITALAFAPSDVSGQIYAYGTEDGQLRLTTDGGGDWAHLDAGNTVPNRYVTGLAFEPTDAQVLYVTLSGFAESTPSQPGHVFKTVNALAATPAWTNVSPPVNLPQDCIAINPANAAEVVVGSDIGLWRSPDRGTNWTHHGPGLGLPNVAVYDAQFGTNGALTAFTHGRGAFIYRYQRPIIDIPVAMCFFCRPDPTWVNPLDLVTLPVLLQNILPVSTENLTARLRATPEITPYNRVQIQSYGALSAGNPPVSRSFVFTVSPTAGFSAGNTCGGLVYATLDLEDNGQNLGSVTIPLRLGRPRYPVSEDFESAAVPGFPAGWFAGPAGVPNAWGTTTNDPPNAGVGVDPDFVDDKPGPRVGPPNVSVFGPDLLVASDTMFYSPVFLLRTDSARLSFRHSFDLESGFDGAVLEISIEGGPFMDILAAGGSFAENGYCLTLRAGSALGGREAWSGDSGGWLVTEVDLPQGMVDRPMQLRWRLASDSTVGKDGWFIDDVWVTEYECLPPVTNPVILRPGFYDQLFGFFIQTVPQRRFYIEYKDLLTDVTWLPLQTLEGDGTEQLILDPTRGPTQRFYRFRVE